MAAQRIRTPATKASARGGAVPSQRRSPEGSGGRTGEGRTRQRSAGQRADSGANAPVRPFNGAAILLAVGMPVAGGLVDQLAGLGIAGWGLLVGSVLGAAGAAWLSSRAGWWWVLPAPPPLVLGVTAGTDYLAHSDSYKDSKALITGAAKWAVHGFPVMLYAMGAALLVIIVRIARDRRSRLG